MKVLLLGGGGREHALAWKLRQSPLLTALWMAPGNPGMETLGTRVALALDTPNDVLAFVRRENVDLVVVGPEAPLVAGVADVLEDAGVPVFGPRRRAAALEGSKAYAKEVMEAARVPTAAFRTFTQPEEAERYARAQGRIVVKADGLAAGKGVVVAQSPDEAVDAVRSLSRLPGAGGRLVLEELLEGQELSVIALCDGDRYVLLPSARDHKRVGDGDTGPNTGGMGAFSPVGDMDAELLPEVGRQVVAPVLRVMRERGTPFRGALYVGLMLTAQGPKVLEFNARFGDPETQVLMLQLGEDLLPLLWDCAQGTLTERALVLRDGCSVGVVLAAPGYPGTPKLGDPIAGLETLPEGVQVFHAGTGRAEGAPQQLVTTGGRVLTVCAHAGSAAEARRLAYTGAAAIEFPGVHYRRDIAASAR